MAIHSQGHAGIGIALSVIPNEPPSIALIMQELHRPFYKQLTCVRNISISTKGCVLDNLGGQGIHRRGSLKNISFSVFIFICSKFNTKGLPNIVTPGRELYTYNDETFPEAFVIVSHIFHRSILI